MSATHRTPLIAAEPNPDGGARVFFGGPSHPYPIDSQRAIAIITRAAMTMPAEQADQKEAA